MNHAGFHVGFYVDLLVPSEDPNYRYEEKRFYFGSHEKTKYKAFVAENRDMIRSHGERYS